MLKMMKKSLKRRKGSEMQPGVRWETPPVCTEGFVDFPGWTSCLSFGFPVSIQWASLWPFIYRHHSLLFSSPTALASLPFSILFLFPNAFPFCSLLLCAHLDSTHREDIVFVQVWLILLSIVFGFVTLPVWLSSNPACACHILKHTVAGAIGCSPA